MEYDGFLRAMPAKTHHIRGKKHEERAGFFFGGKSGFQATQHLCTSSTALLVRIQSACRTD
jgi:hypothetical protein